MFSFQAFGQSAVLALGVVEIAEELAGGSVGDRAKPSLVKLPRLEFHQLRLLPDGLDAERTDEPDRFPMHEAFHILAADERNMLAETPAVIIEQVAAMPALFGRHGVEKLRRSRVIRCE